MITEILYFLLKWTFYMALSFVLYALYKFVYVPYRAKQFYKRFPNVYVNEKLNFPSGDLKQIDE